MRPGAPSNTRMHTKAPDVEEREMRMTEGVDEDEAVVVWVGVGVEVVEGAAVVEVSKGVTTEETFPLLKMTVRAMTAVLESVVVNDSICIDREYPLAPTSPETGCSCTEPAVLDVAAMV